MGLALFMEGEWSINVVNFDVVKLVDGERRTSKDQRYYGNSVQHKANKNKNIYIHTNRKLQENLNSSAEREGGRGWTDQSAGHP